MEPDVESGPQDGGLGNRVALVTGASRGIGRAIALALARAGADVAVHCRSRKDDAADVERAIRGLGRRAVVIVADLLDPDAAEPLVAQAAERLGPLEILVNNAAVAQPRSLDELTPADWDLHLAVNLTAPFRLMRAALPGMRARRWGRIVNISSVAAEIGGVVGPHYAASKAGLQGLTRAYAAQLAREGVTVNAIAPALIDTEMIADNPRARPELLPVGRFGTAGEVAAVALMLATNGFITGQTIQVNGGLRTT
jgi:3-oxoacyl-[acyl-carrier protein] reductase